MKSIRDNLITNLNFYLKEKNITQKELAIKLDVAQSSVTNWVKGNNIPDLDMIDKICKAINISASELFGIEDEYNNTEKKIIFQYRNKKDLQPAVKILLDIKED